MFSNSTTLKPPSVCTLKGTHTNANARVFHCSSVIPRLLHFGLIFSAILRSGERSPRRCLLYPSLRVQESSIVLHPACMMVLCSGNYSTESISAHSTLSDSPELTRIHARRGLSPTARSHHSLYTINISASNNSLSSVFSCSYSLLIIMIEIFRCHLMTFAILHAPFASYITFLYSKWRMERIQLSCWFACITRDERCKTIEFIFRRGATHGGFGQKEFLTKVVYLPSYSITREHCVY